MGFPTVRSDPYKRRRRRRSQLWSAKFWRELVDAASLDWGRKRRGISDLCVEMIGDMNEWMYGKR